MSGDAEHVYVSDATGRIVATCTVEADASLVANGLNARRVLRSLRGSGVLGVNDDGSVWVQGGDWNRSERYATADSDFAVIVQEAIAP